MNKQPKILPRPVVETRKLAKLCEQHGYDYLLIAYPRPGKGQKSMEAEVGYHLETPANLGSLLATLWQMHPDIAHAITAAMNFRAYAAMDAQRVEEGKLVKL
jgi:hypothetical protein